MAADRRSAWPMLNMTQLLNLEMALLVGHRVCANLIAVAGPALMRNGLWPQEELDYNLVVFSPYRDLLVYLQDERLSGLAEFAWCGWHTCFPCISKAHVLQL